MVVHVFTGSAKNDFERWWSLGTPKARGEATISSSSSTVKLSTQMEGENGLDKRSDSSWNLLLSDMADSVRDIDELVSATSPMGPLSSPRWSSLRGAEHHNEKEAHHSSENGIFYSESDSPKEHHSFPKLKERYTADLKRKEETLVQMKKRLAERDPKLHVNDSEIETTSPKTGQIVVRFLGPERALREKRKSSKEKKTRLSSSAPEENIVPSPPATPSPKISSSTMTRAQLKPRTYPSISPPNPCN